MLIARQKIRYLVILNESFLTQVAARLAPQKIIKHYCGLVLKAVIHILLYWLPYPMFNHKREVKLTIAIDSD